MQKKYTISLIVILCGILFCVSIYFDYVGFLSNHTDSLALTLVSEELSINYANGNKISVQDESTTVSFSITNHSDEIKYYYIKLIDIVGNPTASYEITSDIPNFSTISSDFLRVNIVSRFEILPNATHRYTMKINNPQKEVFSFQIDTDIEVIDQSFYNVILSNNNVVYNQDFDFSSVSSTPYLVQKPEQHGDIYYFRGDVKNNYVLFGGLLFRIVKINEDQTVKLILNQTTETMMKMYEKSDENSTFLSSLVEEHLENWYELRLKDYDDFVVSTNYCYDNGVITDENNQIFYLPSLRLSKEFRPTNACSGTKLSQKVAVLSADEAMYAGLNSNENKDNYLTLTSLQGAWWTMTPNKKENEITSFFGVNPNGSMDFLVSESSSLFVRPVITLVKKTRVTGDGTLQNPYVVESSK